MTGDPIIVALKARVRRHSTRVAVSVLRHELSDGMRAIAGAKPKWAGPLPSALHISIRRRRVREANFLNICQLAKFAEGGRATGSTSPVSPSRVLRRCQGSRMVRARFPEAPHNLAMTGMRRPMPSKPGGPALAQALRPGYQELKIGAGGNDRQRIFPVISG